MNHIVIGYVATSLSSVAMLVAAWRWPRVGRFLYAALFLAIGRGLWLWVGVVGAASFLAGISWLGIGAASPTNLLLAAGVVLLLRPAPAEPRGVPRARRARGPLAECAITKKRIGMRCLPRDIAYLRSASRVLDRARRSDHMARKRTTKAKVSAAAIIEQTESVSFQNLGIEWRPRPDGSAELRVAYESPLASRDEVIARAGTWRQGSEPWAETRELPLRREGSRWVGTIPVASGGPVEAVEFVFRSSDEWDNGGSAPLGYYEWNPRQHRVEVR